MGPWGLCMFLCFFVPGTLSLLSSSNELKVFAGVPFCHNISDIKSVDNGLNFFKPLARCSSPLYSYGWLILGPAMGKLTDIPWLETAVNCPVMIVIIVANKHFATLIYIEYDL